MWMECFQGIKAGLWRGRREDSGMDLGTLVNKWKILKTQKKLESRFRQVNWCSIRSCTIYCLGGIKILSVRTPWLIYMCIHILLWKNEGYPSS